MKRFLTIPNRFTENVMIDYVHQDTHDDCRIVDDSSYVSNKRADQVLAKQFAAQLLDNLSFDNPADIRAGTVNVYARQKGRDLAELTQQLRNLESQAERALKQDINSRKEALNTQASEPVPSATVNKE